MKWIGYAKVGKSYHGNTNGIDLPILWGHGVEGRERHSKCWKTDRNQLVSKEWGKEEKSTHFTYTFQDVSVGHFLPQCQVMCQNNRFRCQHGCEANSSMGIIYKRNVSKLVSRLLDPFSQTRLLNGLKVWAERGFEKALWRELFLSVLPSKGDIMGDTASSSGLMVVRSFMGPFTEFEMCSLQRAGACCTPERVKATCGCLGTDDHC